MSSSRSSQGEIFEIWYQKRPHPKWHHHDSVIHTYLEVGSWQAPSSPWGRPCGPEGDGGREYFRAATMYNMPNRSSKRWPRREWRTITVWKGTTGLYPGRRWVKKEITTQVCLVLLSQKETDFVYVFALLSLSLSVSCIYSYYEYHIATCVNRWHLMSHIRYTSSGKIWFLGEFWSKIT